MDDDQLAKDLGSIGMACFVNYFTEFSDESLSDDDVTRILVEQEGWAEISTRNRRVRGARRIIKAGRAKDALIAVSNSSRVPREVVDKALRFAQGSSGGAI